LPWAASIAVLAGAAPAFARDLAVPGDHDDVQSALRAARRGDRVVVVGGWWTDVTVRKAGVSLVGQEGAVLLGTTRLAGRGATLSGFTVAGTVVVTGARAKVLGCEFRESIDVTDAVRITRAADVAVEGNVVHGRSLVADRAKRATFRGNDLQGETASLVVSGPGAVIEENRVAEGYVGVYDPGAAVTGNEVGAIWMVDAAHAVVRDNDVDFGGILVDGRGALVEGNRTPEGAIEVYGDHVTVTSNAACFVAVQAGDGVVVADNHVVGVGVSIAADGALVIGNRIETAAGQSPVAVVGDDVRVVDNEIVGSAGGVWSAGARTEVSGNHIEVTIFGAPNAAVELDGVRASVEDNVVVHNGATGIVVLGDAADIVGNRLDVTPDDASTISGDAITVMGDAITVMGNGALVSENEIEHGARGIVLSADDALAKGNTITQVASDAVQVWSGEGNTVVDTTATNCGRCGFAVAADAVDTKIRDCTATCTCIGFVNAADGTCVDGCTFTDGREVDVFTVTECSHFKDNGFSTSSSDPGDAPTGLRTLSDVPLAVLVLEGLGYWD
jgi:hypothetical protein